MSKKSFYFQSPEYDAIYIVESNTSNSLLLNTIENYYEKLDQFTIKPNDATSLRDSCPVTYRDRLYFYGGTDHRNKIFEFGCDESELHARLKFDFVGGTCGSNNDYILLCFPIENSRLCYKSKSPLPDKWWQWFTYVEFSYATHDSISLSSGKYFIDPILINCKPKA